MEPSSLRAAFVAPVFAPLARGAAGAVCRAKGGRPGGGRKKRAGKPGRPSRRGGARASNDEGAGAQLPGDEAALAAGFEEDVKTPLRPRGGSSKASTANKRVAFKMPEMKFTRENVIMWTTRATWAGVAGLVALFLTVHLVIVRDWFPPAA